MKSVVKYMLFLILLIVPINNIKALSLSKNEVSLNKNSNEEIELYANSDTYLKEVDFSLIYSSYDIVGEFVVNAKYKDTVSSGTKHSVVFDKEEKGKILLGIINIKSQDKDGNGSINLNNAIGITSTKREIGLNSQLVNVVVDDDSANDANRLLKSIKSNIVKIDLEDNNYEYDVYISDKINVLDLVPIPYNNECKIDISSQKLKEINNNKIIIKASLDNIKEEYIINLNIKKIVDDDNDEDEVFVPDNSYKKKWIIITGGLSFLMFINLIILIVKRNR